MHLCVDQVIQVLLLAELNVLSVKLARSVDLLDVSMDLGTSVHLRVEVRIVLGPEDSGLLRQLLHLLGGCHFVFFGSRACFKNIMMNLNVF